MAFDDVTRSFLRSSEPTQHVTTAGCALVHKQNTLIRILIPSRTTDSRRERIYIERRSRRKEIFSDLISQSWDYIAGDGGDIFWSTFSLYCFKSRRKLFSRRSAFARASHLAPCSVVLDHGGRFRGEIPCSGRG